MRSFRPAALAIVATLGLAAASVPGTSLAATPAMLAQLGQIPSADQWSDHPGLAPSVTSPQARAQMNAEIVRAIAEAGDDPEAARQAILEIAARYEAEAPQSARSRPGPK